jgi:hypothetical protein
MSTELKTKHLLQPPHRASTVSNYNQSAFKHIATSPNYIHYSRDIYQIHVQIYFDRDRNQYSALFQKAGELYFPQETIFAAHTLDMLFEHIKIEMRTALFSNFLGILVKQKIFNKLNQECSIIFNS